MQPDIGEAARSANTDRAMVKSMVEDHWRSVIAYVAIAKTPDISRESATPFEKLIKAIAPLMLPEKAQFIQMAEEERELLFNEYNDNPEGLEMASARRYG